jgi:hypothetical protein
MNFGISQAQSHGRRERSGELLAFGLQGKGQKTEEHQDPDRCQHEYARPGCFFTFASQRTDPNRPISSKRRANEVISGIIRILAPLLGARSHNLKSRPIALFGLSTAYDIPSRLIFSHRVVRDTCRHFAATPN